MNKTDRNRLAYLLQIVTKLGDQNPSNSLATVTPAVLARWADLTDKALSQLRWTIMAITRSDSPEENPDDELDELARVVSFRPKDGDDE